MKYFTDEMTKDLTEGKDIVLRSMLRNPTQKYKKKYTDQGYKVVCHNGIEKNNEQLKNYKEEWNKADILVYSPTDTSSSARAFSQMLHRVRQFESDEVLI